MKKAGNGNTVKVHYTGKFDDTVFDSSKDREPLEFTIGKGQLIKGFEGAVVGMSEKESKTVTIPSDEAYGPHRNELVFRVPRGNFPPDIEPREGVILTIKQPDGNSVDVLVVEVTPEAVTLDANHPLAGKDLTFDIELMEVA